MPVYGDLNTFQLPDLLQWIGVAQKTGVLEIQRGGGRRRLEFSKGYIVACHADDATDRFGQLLVDRGLITPDELDAARAEQESAGKRLGFILVKNGVIRESDVQKMITAHVEQSIQNLFEWSGADFRFYEGASFDPVRIEVGLTVNDVLLRTLQHQDELKQIRETFPSSTTVLRRNGTDIPDALSGMSRKIFESVDGRRTIGEVVTESRASEVLVLKLLHALAARGLVEIAEVGAAPPGSRSLLDPPPPPVAPVLEETHDEPAPAGVDAELATAHQLNERNEAALAVEVLKAASRAYPEDARVGGLLEQITADRPDLVSDSRLPLSHIPVLADVGFGEALDSEQSFLLSLVDGCSDVQAIVGLAALREAEVLGTLEVLLDKGCIALREP